jgi:hypothetical protein
MPYDEDLANRIRAELGEVKGLSEKRMFGGLAFLLHGHMVISASHHGGALVRVGADGSAEAAARPHTSVPEMRGRPMTGFVYVEPDGVRTKRQLDGWIRRALAYVTTLPPKR